MEEPESPQLRAMREAMRLAEEAAEERRLAKLKAKEADMRVSAGMDVEALEVLRATAVNLPEYEDEEALEAFELGGESDISEILEALDAEIPDLDTVERHGDLVVFRHEDQAKPWYQLAAEEALPEPLRQLNGPLDVKHMLQALIVEVGDVKRTNAIIMDQLARLDEKIERTNRLLRDRRQH